jgi:pyruvate kinase
MYDTKGPEFRTLKFKDGGVSLKKDDTIRMSKTCILGDEKEFGVNHSNAIDFIKIGDTVLIDNALFELEVIDKDDDYVLLKALGDCKIQDNKTVNVPGVDLNLKFMSDVDKRDIAFAAKHACDYLALSFVNTREDVMAARKII